MLWNELWVKIALWYLSLHLIKPAYALSSMVLAGNQYARKGWTKENLIKRLFREGWTGLRKEGKMRHPGTSNSRNLLPFQTWQVREKPEPVRIRTLETRLTGATICRNVPGPKLWSRWVKRENYLKLPWVPPSQSPISVFHWLNPNRSPSDIICRGQPPEAGPNGL